jgi:proteasome lid subunit RPN8/RPN11
MCHAGPTEVAGFGLTSPHNPLYLDDVLLIRQRATSVTVAFDDNAVADLFDLMADRGIPASRFARVWLHSHPGASVTPSGVDEQTFVRCFGGCDWAVMGILGRTGRTYARLRFNAGPGTAIVIPTRVNWGRWPALVPELPLRLDEWQREYDAFVEVVEFRIDNWFGSRPDSSLQQPSSRSELGTPVEISETDCFHSDFDLFPPSIGERHAFD